ncbi:MAG: hypothetical protein GEU96_08240 [Propionibacteriales bacterium]|nr:hypothetical protein [Propionibacteriales bacterium]
MSESNRRAGRRAGTEPVTARSSLGLRVALSWSALAVSVVAAAVLFVVAPGASGSRMYAETAIVCLVVALIAAVDLIVITRRRRHQRSSH